MNTAITGHQIPQLEDDCRLEYITVGALAEAPIYVINKTMDKNIVLKKWGGELLPSAFMLTKKAHPKAYIHVLLPHRSTPYSLV